MTADEITLYLREFAAKHDLVAKAISGCWKCVENLLEEGEADAKILRGPGVENLAVFFKKHFLVFEHEAYETPFISTQIILYVKDDENPDFAQQFPLGIYDYETYPDGELRDDWFVLYPPIN
ncbi:hypothetical protein EON80_04620 [bacterium]|nr:MAG: hypothetical protein EON80_04620 [bacterium]